eukprot:TRINITY_DN5109_c0_g1_i3.p1 TRINITY_DN5109_c0_g1~~TRINITY_DN5109_c0_g1_i3.p1  ORF type:complete len:239 (+),score=46.33 TRINITY_DN5109_c0_g1_i3:328-1044(+)
MLRVRYHCPALLVTEPGDGSVTVTVPMDVTDGGRIIVFDPPLSCTESGKWEVQVLSAIRGGAHYFGLVGQSVWDSMLENIVEKQGEQQNAPTDAEEDDEEMQEDVEYDWCEANGYCMEDGNGAHNVQHANKSGLWAMRPGDRLEVSARRADGVTHMSFAAFRGPDWAPAPAAAGGGGEEESSDSSSAHVQQWETEGIAGGRRDVDDDDQTEHPPLVGPALFFLYLFNKGDSVAARRIW